MLRLQNIVLEMIAKGDPLHETIDRLCSEVEAMVPEAICSVLAVDRDGLLRPLSSPSLPTSYSTLFDGLKIGPSVGSCGTAAFRGTPISVTDIATDPLWEQFRHLALPHGLAACWSSPILNSNGRVIATFAFYYRKKRGPGELELGVVSTCTHLCAIALERQERVLESERLAYTDPLTGLWNRAKFDLALQRSANTGALHGLLLIDIDNFKSVNDTFGHRTGDAVIQVVAARTAAAVAPHLLFRLSGDEFAVVVEQSNDLRPLAERILTATAVSAECNGHSVVPTVTVGGASLDRGQKTEDFRHRADFALYHARNWPLQYPGGSISFGRSAMR